MTKLYFGTDGIRGPYGKDPISKAFMTPLGNAIAYYLDQKSDKPSTVVIGQDPRESGNILASALASTLSKQGIHVHRLSIVPTAAVPLYLLQNKASLGIAITASHNPASDNGLKFFNHEGHKLSSHEEDVLEALINKHSNLAKAGPGKIKQVDGKIHYTTFIQNQFKHLDLQGWSIALDTANGATYQTTPTVLSSFNADVHCIGNQPDGKNINAAVGSEYPGKLSALVKETKAKIGIAHDGDGDRVIFCDETGSIIDGDEILGILALQLKKEEKLPKHTIVTTIQSNSGLEQTLQANNITLKRANVGDRNVLYKMIEDDCPLGGENSGHIIFKNILPAGDGLIAALKVIELMQATGKPLSSLRKSVKLFPQITDTLVVKEKKPLSTLIHLPKAIELLEEKLGNDGRVLVRYSGTEPKLRFLIEGPHKDFLEEEMTTLKTAASKELS